jgi:hypothetical protein
MLTAMIKFQEKIRPERGGPASRVHLGQGRALEQLFDDERCFAISIVIDALDPVRGLGAELAAND